MVQIKRSVTITLTLPLPVLADILRTGIEVPLATTKTKWSAACLGAYEKEKGVYIIHHDNIVQYVGATEGPSMNFGTRLRRHFTEKGGAGKYHDLKTLPTPPPILASFITLKEIDGMIPPDLVKYLLQRERVLLAEEAAQKAYKPRLH